MRWNWWPWPTGTTPSQVRNELETAGYGLLHLQFSRAWSALRVDFGVENLFDRHTPLPTGGAYLGQSTTMSINPRCRTIPRWGRRCRGLGVRCTRP